MRALTYAIAILVSLFLAETGQAMDIVQFDKMAADDQDAYTAELVVGGMRALKEAGSLEQAEKLRHLFTDVKPGDKASLGMVELEVNLAAVSAAEAKRQARNPNLRHLTVEDAFKAVTDDHGIVLPSSFMHVMDSFRPKLPLTK